MANLLAAVKGQDKFEFVYRRQAAWSDWTFEKQKIKPFKKIKIKERLSRALSRRCEPNRRSSNRL